MVGSQKVKHRIATGSRISLLGVHPKELKAETQISVLGSIVHNSQRGGEDNPKGHYQMNVIIQTKCGIMYIGMLVLKKKKILTHATNE